MRAARDVVGLRLLMAAALVAVAALLVALPLIAQHVDAQSAPYETEVARFQLAQALKRLALRTEEGAIDDVVFQHADPRVDQTWFQKNMTSPRVADVESQIVFTFDARNDVSFARDRGSPIVGRRKDDFTRALKPLVEKLRRLERGSEQIRRYPRQGYVPPVVAGTTSIVVRGRVYDVQAFLIGSKSGMVAQRAARAPALLLVTDVEQCLLPAFRDHLKLRDVAVIRQDPTSQQGSIPLLGINGGPIAHIVWTPRRPGVSLFKHLLAPVLIAVGLLLAATVSAYRRGSRMAIALALSEATSYRLAFYDHLTGLPNRRLLTVQLDALLDRAEADRTPLALLLLDLDRFKSVNDTFGHQCGDELIQKIAQRLSATAGPNDFCARLGGDEFVIVSFGSDSEAAARLACRVLAALRKPFALSKSTIGTTGSIGITMHLGGASDAGALVREADVALYQVKNKGRDNFCFFEASMDFLIQDRRTWDATLGTVVDRSKHEGFPRSLPSPR